MAFSTTVTSHEFQKPSPCEVGVDASIDYSRKKFELSLDNMVRIDIQAQGMAQSCRYSVSKLLDAYYKSSTTN